MEDAFTGNIDRQTTLEVCDNVDGENIVVAVAVLSQSYEDYLSDEPGQHGIPDGLTREEYAELATSLVIALSADQARATVNCTRRIGSAAPAGDRGSTPVALDEEPS